MSEQTSPNTKPAYLSKTIWGNLLVALLPLVPGLEEIFKVNPWLHEGLFLAANFVLRAVTKDKLTLW
jgi:hypothetical protein